MQLSCNRCLHDVKGVCELDVCRPYPKYKVDMINVIHNTQHMALSQLWNMNNGELDALLKGEQFGRKPVYLTVDEIDDILSVLPCNDVLIAKLRRAKYGNKK